MKLIIAIVRDADTDAVSHALTTADLRVTQVASTGGFLQRGNTTLLIGLEDEQTPLALDIIRDNLGPAEPNAHRATVFVINVDQYIHI